MEATHPVLGLFTVPKRKNTWDSCLSVVSASNIGKGFLLYLQGFTNTGKKKSIRCEQAFGRTKRNKGKQENISIYQLSI